MTSKDKTMLKDRLSIIVGTPLREISRIGPVLYFEFGDIVEVDDIMVGEDGRPLWDENGKGVPTKSLAGKYCLQTMLSMRFICGNDVVLAKSDIFLPTEEQANKESFVWDTFDWFTIGNTVFDEMIVKHFRDGFSDYIVKNVKVGKFGDLTISFENDFVLEFFADGSGLSENWRFGETNATESLIVTSQGIIEE